MEGHGSGLLQGGAELLTERSEVSLRGLIPAQSMNRAPELLTERSEVSLRGSIPSIIYEKGAGAPKSGFQRRALEPGVIRGRSAGTAY
jgi:hypothetical protein